MNDPTELPYSLEELDGRRWPEPGSDSTSLVKAVHSLRKRPIGSLKPEELRRLVGQDVGLRWLLPLAVKHLRDTTGGIFYDDDLLSAVLTRKPEVWEEFPEIAEELRDLVASLPDISIYMEPEVETFLTSTTPNNRRP